MRHRHAVLLVVVLPLLTGCALLRATVGGWAVGPDGIAVPQQRLRNALAAGDYDAMLAVDEGDSLLRVLTAGTADYYAGRFARSGALLDTAALVADDRITASVSRDALSLITNDMARAYQPRRTERLFVAYYGMLSFARLGAWEDAAVEARRMASLVAQYQESRSEAERPLHAAMEYLAGVVFERAGDAGEAAVAYRIAHAMMNDVPSAASPLRDGEGEVLVVVERGFVAHRTTATISIPLGSDDCDSIRSTRVWHALALRAAEDVEDTAASGTSAPALTLTSAAPTAETSGIQPQIHHEMGITPAPLAPRRWRLGGDDDDLDVERLAIALPVLRRSARVWSSGVTLGADNVVAPAVRLAANVDDATAADERRERLSFATRAVARAATKYALTKAVRDKKGEAAGTLAALGANMFERADVRSWHLLPQEVELIRMRVPAGTRSLWLSAGAGSVAREMPLPNVTVTAGRVTIVPVRIWRDQSIRLASADSSSACSEAGCR